MLRFAIRHGLVRMIGGRAVPAMLAWDLLVLANKTRQIPVVGRIMRRGASAARGRLGAVASAGARSVSSARRRGGPDPEA